MPHLGAMLRQEHETHNITLRSVSLTSVGNTLALMVKVAIARNNYGGATMPTRHSALINLSHALVMEGSNDSDLGVSDSLTAPHYPVTSSLALPVHTRQHSGCSEKCSGVGRSVHCSLSCIKREWGTSFLYFLIT